MKEYVKIFAIKKMPDEDKNVLKYFPGEKSLKGPFIIHADSECLLRKINTWQNNPEKSYTEKKAKHRPSGYSLVTCCSSDKSKNERKYYRGEDCMKKSCKDSKDQATKVINFEKKEMISLTGKEKESYENQKVCYICEKIFVLIKIINNLKKCEKSEIIVIIQENIEELLIVVVI